MIDTVHLRIDARKFPGILARLKDMSEKKFYGSKVQKKYLNVRVLEVEDKLLASFTGFYKIPSSNYDITFKYQRETEKIDINLSIPKYRYGHNVCQFLISQDDPGFNIGYINVEWQKEKMYQNFYRFLERFSGDVFQGRIKMEDIEVRRIDMCYNLVFETPEDLERYYERVKLIRMKYLREGSNKLSSYESSFHYVGKGWSFKVYKKGIEFKKNDKRQLIKFNEVNEKEQFPIDRIEYLAERTLRFEMTFRNEYMSDYYRAKLYRSNCPYWNSLKRGVTSTGKNVSYLDKKIYKKALDKNTIFLMDVAPEVSKSNTFYDGEVLTQAKFSYVFMCMLWDKFWEKVESFRMESIDVLKNFDTVSVKEKNQIEKIKKLLVNYSIDELVDMKLISKRTKYRYRKILKTYGMGLEYLSANINVDWGYSTYFSKITTLGLLKKRN